VKTKNTKTYSVINSTKHHHNKTANVCHVPFLKKKRNNTYTRDVKIQQICLQHHHSLVSQPEPLPRSINEKKLDKVSIIYNHELHIKLYPNNTKPAKEGFP